MVIHDREYETYYGPLDFEGLTIKVEQSCRHEVAAGARYGFGAEHHEMFSTHEHHAAEARRIYREALEVARTVAQEAITRQTHIAAERMRAAGLGDFAHVIETGETDPIIF